MKIAKNLIIQKISLFILLATMYSCSIKSLKVAEDILQGEAEVMEKVITDVSVVSPLGMRIDLIKF